MILLSNLKIEKGGITMKDSFAFDYINENEFKKLERSLKKYNMLAYKKLYFEFYPSLKEGVFLGELVSTNQAQGTKTYELKLPTDILFSKVHGDIKLHYLIYENDRIVMLDKLTPENILSEGHQSELVTYKGVMVSKQHTDKDIFKINLLNMIKIKSTYKVLFLFKIYVIIKIINNIIYSHINIEFTFDLIFFNCLSYR